MITLLINFNKMTKYAKFKLFMFFNKKPQNFLLNLAMEALRWR